MSGEMIEGYECCDEYFTGMHHCIKLYFRYKHF